MAAAAHAVAPLARLLRRAERIVVFSGAGLSKASGIPTYRDSGGLWTEAGNLRWASIDALRDDPRGFAAFWQQRRCELAAALPNAAHIALAQLQRLKPQTTLVTQNVDGLLSRAGARDVLELHGALSRSYCGACGAKDPPATPEGCCLACGSSHPTVRPDVVMFGEYLDERVIASAEFAAKRCDVLLAVGTSAVVYPAAGLIGKAKSRGASVAVLNTETIELAHLADVELLGKAEELLPPLVDALAAPP